MNGKSFSVNGFNLNQTIKHSTTINNLNLKNMKTKLFLLIMAIATFFTSCKKDEVTFEKGQINFKANGNAVNCTIGVTGQYTIGNTVTLSGTDQSGISMPKSLTVVLEDVSGAGTYDDAGTDQKKVVYTYSDGANVYATHWNDVLVGDASMTVEILTASEFKGTFTGTLKKQDGSASISITDGKAWVTY